MVKTKLRVGRPGDSLKTQKYVAVYRHRRGKDVAEGFFAVGSMLNRVKRLKKPFVQWYVTNDLESAVSYAIRHKVAWDIPLLKIEKELLADLEKSDNWDIVQQHLG
tara:strand:- start:13939 stop:14256 length:318 start_codon:yes stop_codon:yes gene_type:complete